jgi:hypothetical protein
MIAIAIAFFLTAGTLTNAMAQSFQETQQTSNELLTDDLATVNGQFYTIRWAPTTTVEGDTMTAVFADCASDEFAVDSQYMLESQYLLPTQSFTIALDESHMAYLTILINVGDEAMDAATGVTCVSDSDNDNDNDDVDIDDSTRTTIQNTINEISQGGPINIQYLTQVYQKIYQNAIQIAIVTGNNNTVNQVINQTANQIIESNTTSPQTINQIVNQTAQQIGVVTGSNNTLNQGITQGAQQQGAITNATTATTISVDEPEGDNLNTTTSDISEETTTTTEDTTTEEEDTTPTFDAPLDEETESEEPTTDEEGDAGEGDEEGDGDGDGTDEEEEDNNPPTE